MPDASSVYVEKKIAIPDGPTTEIIKLMLELFLHNNVFKLFFVNRNIICIIMKKVFSNSDLEEFKPDLLYICTCIRNVE